MKVSVIGLVFFALVAGNALGSEDRRACKEELARLKESFDANYTSQNHHDYRRAKASRDNEEYRKCASQARKARERAEREEDL